MKSILTSLLVISLAGCVGFPTPKKFPELPEALTTQCPELKLVPEGTEKLSEVLKVVTKNYEQYHECRIKVETWLKWYKDQKEIFDKED